MIEKTWLPQALSIGISYNEFWDMNPHIVNIYADAHKIELREKNQLMHLQGIYVRDALLSSVGNMFRSKSSKEIEYPKEPYDIFGGEDLTEYEKVKQTEQIFANLEILMHNFESNKKKPIVNQHADNR